LSSTIAATAATVTTAAASVATASGCATAATVGSLVDTDPTAIELLVVHSLHSSIGLRVLGIANEAEAPATSSIAVLDDDSFFDLTELVELLAKSLVVGVPRKASNEEFRHGDGCLDRTLNGLNY
jgi:hypothetical protein